MICRIAIVMALAGVLWAAASAEAEEPVCLSDTCFDREREAEGITLPLRGAAELDYWGLDVYTAALYVSEEARSIDEILGETPRLLVIHYERSIRRSDIIKATEKGLRHQANIDHHGLRSRLEILYGWYRNVKEGDRFDVIYTPDHGTTLRFNRELCGVIEGDDFARAFFGIWLSEEPLDEDLRDELIGRT